MIIDTSALVAVARFEPGHEAINAALARGGVIPSPVVVEFLRVMTDRGKHPSPEADSTIDYLRNFCSIEPLIAEDGMVAARANEPLGLGNGRGGSLNFGDLMVYAVAKRLSMPVLCTGRDFAATDIAIHPASRVS